MDNLFFLEAKCVKSGKTFYPRYDLATDDYWVLTYGEKTLPAGQNVAGSQGPRFNIARRRVGPQYKCPHCGNKKIFLSKDCGAKACCYDGADTWRCPLNGSTGTFSSEGASSISGSSGKGQ